MSLGRAWVHGIDDKLKEASDAGFQGVEIFYEDLEYLAKTFGDLNETNLLQAAAYVRQVCDEFNLMIIGLQPFLFYEGLIDRTEHKAKIEKLKTWFKIVKILGTDLIQIPGNFQSEGISGELSLIVNDMKEVADLGLKEDPPVRFAYENLAWSTYVDTWEKLWEVVKLVDRPNFGCCLDTFNIAGRIWADPASPTGKTPDADNALKLSLEQMVETIDVQKVFYIQVVDAERLKEPLVEGHKYYNKDQPARMSWSRNCRLFLYEHDRGAYMPVVDIARTIIKELKFVGWISMELFSRTMADANPSVPHTHAQRAMKSYKRLAEELNL